MAAIRPGGKPPGVWALPKGLIGEGEKPEETALREVAEETGVEARSLGKLGDVRYVYTWAGERIFKVVSFYLLRYSSGPARGHSARARARGRRGALAAARARLRRCSRTGASARWLRRRSRPYHPDALYALNFYSPLVADQLRSLRKTATIRLGDKSGKYKKGMIVQVLAGARFGPREKIFDAVIDKIEVKTLGELSPREIEHDNPEIRRPEEMAHFLSQLYNREVTEDDTVTVIRFSKIKG